MTYSKLAMATLILCLAMGAEGRAADGVSILSCEGRYLIDGAPEYRAMKPTRDVVVSVNMPEKAISIIDGFIDARYKITSENKLKIHFAGKSRDYDITGWLNRYSGRMLVIDKSEQDPGKDDYRLDVICKPAERFFDVQCSVWTKNGSTYW